MWNVKIADFIDDNEVLADLIDTLWNVKLGLLLGIVCITLDLIDTLWNVKSILFWSRHRPRPRFNRYIVECKDVQHTWNV